MAEKEAYYGVVKPPNEEFRGNRKRGSLAQPESKSSVNPPNAAHGDRRNNGSMSLAGHPSPVRPPNHRFTPHRMAQPDSVHTPGKGAVPIRPFGPTGLPNISNILRDNVRSRTK